MKHFIYSIIACIFLTACNSSGGKLDCMQEKCPCPKAEKKACACSHKCVCKKTPCKG